MCDTCGLETKKGNVIFCSDGRRPICPECNPESDFRLASIDKSVLDAIQRDGCYDPEVPIEAARKKCGRG